MLRMVQILGLTLVCTQLTQLVTLIFVKKIVFSTQLQFTCVLTIFSIEKIYQFVFFKHTKCLKHFIVETMLFPEHIFIGYLLKKLMILSILQGILITFLLKNGDVANSYGKFLGYCWVPLQLNF